MAPIRIGTSGFSYDDWKGVFYPATTPKRLFLEYYATRFDTLELNATFYALPALKTLEGMVTRTPPNFTFVVKAHQALTHLRGAAGEALLPSFRMALRPFADAGKLGAVLLQFPYAFQPVSASRAWVETLSAGLAGVPLVAEFRHRAWFNEDVLAWLTRLGLSVCCVDEPPLPGLPPPAAVVTGPVGYVRFHGRNREAWWSGERPAPDAPIGHDRGPAASARYRYRYSPDELREWVPRLATMGRQTSSIYVFFNNHPDGNAPKDADAFRGILAGAG